MEALASLQSPVGSPPVASPVSAQSRSALATLAVGLGRYPSLSASRKQVSAPSQSWSTPSPVTSVAPGWAEPAPSSQSPTGSPVTASPESEQSASALATVDVVSGR